MTTIVSGDWYRVSDMPPPLGVRVRVMWSGRLFEAARVLHPVSRAECWVSYDRRLGAIFLPLPDDLRRPDDPASPWMGWSQLTDGPEVYQPLNRSLWSVPLPAPVRFPTVSRAKPSVPRGGSPLLSGGGDTHQWWRNPLTITYEPEGGVSLRMVEGRVMRAVAWCGVGQGLKAQTRTPLDLLAALAEAAEGSVGRDKTSKFVPLPQDVSDFDVAMRWYAQLNPPHTRPARRRSWSLNRMQRVLQMRALPVPPSFGEIAHELHLRSAERPRQIYKEAIVECWKVANGVTKDVAIEAARERNRAARRRG